MSDNNVSETRYLTSLKWWKYLILSIPTILSAISFLIASCVGAFEEDNFTLVFVVGIICLFLTNALIITYLFLLEFNMTIKKQENDSREKTIKELTEKLLKIKDNIG